MTTSTSDKILSAFVWAKNCLADLPNMRAVVKELDECIDLISNAIILTETDQNKMQELYDQDPDIFLGEEFGTYLDFLTSTDVIEDKGELI